MPGIISTDDLAAFLGDEEVGTSPRAVLLVDLANGVVTDALGGVADEPTARVRAIALEVAGRAYRNPQGYSSETIDDYTYRRDAETRQAGVYLTAGERAELAGMAAPVGGMFTVDLGTPVGVLLWP